MKCKVCQSECLSDFRTYRETDTKKEVAVHLGCRPSKASKREPKKKWRIAIPWHRTDLPYEECVRRVDVRLSQTKPPDYDHWLLWLRWDVGMANYAVIRDAGRILIRRGYVRRDVADFLLSLVREEVTP